MADETTDRDNTPALPQSRENFDAQAYLDANPDVARAIAQGAFGGNPYRHWIEFGQREGRKWTPRTATPATTPTTTPPATGTSYDKAKIQAILAKFPHTPAGLAQALPEVQKLYPGIKITGSKGDKLDMSAYGGKIVDVITSAGTGGTGWQWLEPDGASATAPGGPNFGGVATNGADPFAYTNGSLLTPWMEDYKNTYGDAPQFKPIDGFVAPEATKIDAYKLPTWEEVMKNDPGIAFRINQGEGALENSAAARHFLHTGATLKDIVDYGQKAASQEYGVAADRSLNSYGANVNATQTNNQNALTRAQLPYQYAYDQNLAANNQASSAYDKNVANSFAQYLQRYNQFNANQQNQFNRLNGVAGLG